MTPNRPQRQWVGLALVLLGALGFSAKAIFVKLAYAESSQVDAITLMALRMLFALPFFLAAAIWHSPSNRQPLTARHWFLLGGLGLVGYYLSSYFDFLGLQYISAGLERVILFLYPTFVVMYSAVFFRRKVTAKMIAALSLSYFGLALTFAGTVSVTSEDIWLGSAFVLASALLFAGFTLASGQLTPLVGSARFTAYTMLAASTATLLHCAVQRGLAVTGLPSSIYALIGLMAIFSTVLPAFFMNAGIQRLGASTASVVSSIGPIMTLVLAYWLLNEPVSYLQMAGTVLVLAGVYTVSNIKKPAS